MVILGYSDGHIEAHLEISNEEIKPHLGNEVFLIEDPMEEFMMDLLGVRPVIGYDDPREAN